MKPNLIKVFVFSLIGLVIIGLAFIFATRYIYKSKATAGEVKLGLNPTAISSTLNGEADVSVMFTGNVGEYVSGATVVAQYDSDYLSFLGTDNTAPCDGLNTEISAVDAVVSGATTPTRQITWTKIAVKPDVQLPSGLFCFGKLKFKAQKSGTAHVAVVLLPSAQISGPQPLTFALNPNQSTAVVTITGSGSTTPTLTPIPPGDTPLLNFKVKLQGVLGMPSGASTLPVRVTVAKTDGSFSQVFSKVQITPTDVGVWSGTVALTSVPAGTGYRILVKGPKHLQRKFCDLVPVPTENGAYICGTNTVTLVAGTNEADFTKVPLLVGDLPPQDGLLNAFDAAQMRVNLLTVGQSAIDAADLNYDGVVNSTDYSLLIQSMQLKYDEEQ